MDAKDSQLPVWTSGAASSDPKWGWAMWSVAGVRREGSRGRLWGCMPVDGHLPGSALAGGAGHQAEGCDLLKVRSVHWSSARDSIAGFWQDLCSSGMSWLSVLAGLHTYAPLLHIPSRAVKVCPTERHCSHAGQPLLAGCPV